MLKRLGEGAVNMFRVFQAEAVISIVEGEMKGSFSDNEISLSGDGVV